MVASSLQEKTIKVSVIVAMYNAAGSIGRLLGSLKRQTLNEFEVLIVNDGSTDTSAKICEELMRGDSRFILLQKENGGVASARQMGIENARGEYSIHADADDWVEPTMLEEMYAKAKETDADVVIADFYSEDGEITRYVKQQPTSLEASQVFRDLFQQLHGSCWNKLVRRVCYNKCHARFFPGIDYCEDLFFWYQLFSHPGVRCAYIDKAYYHYVCSLTHASIMGSYSRKFLEMGRLLVQKMEEVLPDGPLKEEAIRHFKISQKCGAFEHPIYTTKEYKAIYPECNRFMFRKDTTFVNAALLWLSCHGFYKIATTLYQVKNKITGHQVR